MWPKPVLFSVNTLCFIVAHFWLLIKSEPFDIIRIIVVEYFEIFFYKEWIYNKADGFCDACEL